MTRLESSAPTALAALLVANVLHLTVVFGAFLVASLGGPVLLVLLLVALKTAFDAGAHLREHGRARRRVEARRREAPDGGSARGREARD